MSLWSNQRVPLANLMVNGTVPGGGLMGRQTASCRTGASPATATNAPNANGLRRRLLLAGTALATSLMVSTNAAEA